MSGAENTREHPVDHRPGTIRFRANEPAVVSDIIDGEAVIMNLELGNYYSLDGIGSDCWRMITAGHAVDAVATAAARHFRQDRARIAADVSQLIDALIEHSLIVPRAGAVLPEDLPAGTFTATEYAPPLLSVFSDMKDLLALDPPMPVYDPKRSS